MSAQTPRVTIATDDTHFGAVGAAADVDGVIHGQLRTIGTSLESLDNAVDGNEWWNLRSYNNQEVAPGLYIYVVETPGGEKIIDKFAVVR